MLKQNSMPEKAISLKTKRQRVLEIAFICSLLLLSALFYSFKKFDSTTAIIIPMPDEPITAVDIPVTIHPEKIRRPALPLIPVASEDDEFCEDYPIDFGDIDIEALIASSGPPVEDEEKIYEFKAVQVKPTIVLMAQPIYPEIARKSGTTGLVVIRVLIDKQGNVEKAEIYKSVTMLDDAALDAAKRCKFKPAMQRDKCVKVWMSIPFKFMLK